MCRRLPRPTRRALPVAVPEPTAASVAPPLCAGCAAVCALVLGGEALDEVLFPLSLVATAIATITPVVRSRPSMSGQTLPRRFVGSSGVGSGGSSAFSGGGGATRPRGPPCARRRGRRP